ncbi:MAG: TIGR00730 family Rossman fold protein [Prevotellaceae bacterium]|jgi:uncharacterized protein (TIGR00730 family)|nr:TIGR00730 family Rossman fold protein [Prevotellaceae bacterium]
MKNVAIFCASSTGNDEIYVREAKKLGEVLALKGINLIYGGASIGLMNVIASAALDCGGTVTGIIPRFLDKMEITKLNCTEIIYTDTMSERKTKMFEISDGIIALPGGFGTLDELFEALTLSQLQFYNAPVGMLNIDGFYDCLLKLLDNMTEKGFIWEKNRNKLIVSSSIEDLLEKMTKK